MLQRPSHRGLRHLALGVRDLEAMKRFYVDLLGFEVEWEPDADNLYLSSGLDNLALHFGEISVEFLDALEDFVHRDRLDDLEHLAHLRLRMHEQGKSAVRTHCLARAEQ